MKVLIESSGWVDVLLLAACRLSHARLWTKDAALAQTARRMDVGFST